MLKAEKINQKKTNQGAQAITPLLKKKSRDPVNPNITPTPKKRADEARPWAAHMERAPRLPTWVCLRILEITRAMWATEEYATSTFRSTRRIQRQLIRAPPTRAK